MYLKYFQKQLSLDLKDCDSVHGGGGGFFLQRGLCPGGVSVVETPLYGNMWTVRILLECILGIVLKSFTCFSRYHWKTWKNEKSCSNQEKVSKILKI